MSNPRQSNFSVGEVSPAASQSPDKAFYQAAVKTARNVTVLRTGGLQSVPGTQHLGSTKDDGVAVLVEAVFDDDEGYVLEFGNLYVRVWLAGSQVGTQTTAAWSVSSIAYVKGQTVTNNSGPVNVYVCILAHTSAAGSEPGVGASWETYWYLLGTAAAAVYEFPTPYTTAQLDAVKAQAKVTGLNTLTIVHPSHEPATLTRIPNPNAAAEWVWVLNDIDITNASVIPANVAVSGTGGSGAGYTVTSVIDGEESGAGAYVRTNISPTGGYLGIGGSLNLANRTITWDAVPGADSYNVYGTATEGNFGQPALVVATGVATNSYVDAGAAWYGPWVQRDPPTPAQDESGGAVFDAAGKFPSVVGAYQQRLALAGSDDEPDVVYASRSADPYNFNVSNPIVDSDAMSWRQLLAGGRLNRIRHFAEVAQRLVQFASASEAVIQGDGLILRPSEVNPRVISQNGSAIYPAPLVINDTALYVQARQGIVRDLVPLEQGFVGSDLTLLSAHLVDGYTIEDWCYQQTPNSVAWVVRSDGSLLSLTYVRELGIVGWTTRDTDGDFLSVACVPESGKDVVYAVVERTINSQTKRYVERFYDRSAFIPIQMDSAKSVTMTSGAVTGLSHLEGETVSVMKSDGTILASPYNPAYTAVTVASGGFTISGAGNATVYVGLPFVSDIQTLDMDLPNSTVKPSAFLITAVGAAFEETMKVFASSEAPTTATGIALPAGGEMQEFQVLDRNETAVTTPQTGYRMLKFEGRWSQSGSVFIRNIDPTPLTVLALVPYGTFPR